MAMTRSHISDHMQSVRLRRLAMARAAFALLACSDEQEPVLSIINAEKGCDEAGGLTTDQQAHLLAAINDAPFSALAAADEVTNIIATNHGDDELACHAAHIDLIRTLRQIEPMTRFDEAATAAILSGTSAADKHAAAAQAIFRLREIGRMVGPLVDLLAPQVSVLTGHNSSHAAAAE